MGMAYLVGEDDGVEASGDDWPTCAENPVLVGVGGGDDRSQSGKEEELGEHGWRDYASGFCRCPEAVGD